VHKLTSQIPNRGYRLGWPGRCFALVCGALVLALGVVSVSDQLHAQLHEVPAGCGHADHSVPDDAEHDVTCAVELFASGVSVPVDPTHLVIAPLAVISQASFPAHEFQIAAPDHGRPPGRGPPRV
jgi:hypothetical protein